MPRCSNINKLLSFFVTCRAKHHVYQPSPLHLNLDVGISGLKKKGDP